MRRRTIGVLMASMVGAFYRTILAGIMQAAQERDIQLLVVQSSAEQLEAAQLAVRRADGWIAVFERAGVEQLHRAGVPIVTVSSTVAGVPAILPDNIGGMLMATRHLIGLGHRRIAFIGSTTNSDMPERLHGYRTALEEAGLTFDERLVFWSRDDTIPAGREIGRKILEHGIDWTAFAVATDQNALGLLEMLQGAGIRVPEDVALTGFDDMPEAQAALPPLTTIRLRFDEMGRASVVRLLEQIAQPQLPPVPTTIHTSLVVRRSCGSTAEIAGLHMPEMVAETWREQLAQRLVRAVAYPIEVPPNTPADSIWASVGTPIALLEAALDGQTGPDDITLQQAWEDATRISVYPDSLNAVLEILEDAAEMNPAFDGRVHGVRTALRRLRTALLRVSANYGAVLRNHMEGAIQTLEFVSQALTVSDSLDCRTLRWLNSAPISWGCLGLWEERGAARALRIVGTLPEQHAPVLNTLCDAAEFPPESLAGAAGAARDQLILLEAVETSQRHWGVLALGMSFVQLEQLVTTPHLWAASLAARLDTTDLLDTLASQRNAMQLAYDRERGLADTIRELGCPIMPIDSSALLVPLIGMIDTVRAGQIIEEVTRAVSRTAATDLLLDVTGVPLIDTHVAGVLLQMAQMVQLLGARTMLIGVRPEIAQSLVGLGMNLQQLESVSSLDAAIRRLRRRKPELRT